MEEWLNKTKINILDIAMNDIDNYIVSDKNTTEDNSNCNDSNIYEEILYKNTSSYGTTSDCEDINDSNTFEEIHYRNTSNSIIVKPPHNCKENLDNILYEEILNHILNRLRLHKVWSNRNPLYGFFSLAVLSHMMTNSIKIYQKKSNCSENEIKFIRIFRQTVLYYHNRPNEVKSLVSKEHPLIMIYLNKIYNNFSETIFSNTFVYHMKLSTSDRDFHRYQNWKSEWINYRKKEISQWDDPIEYRYKFEELTQ